MEEELMVPKEWPSEESNTVYDIQQESLPAPEFPRATNTSGRGRKPKRKRGRPPNKNKVQVKLEPKNEPVEIKDDESLRAQCTDTVSVKLEKVDTDVMVGKLEKKKLLEVMSEQFNCGEVPAPARGTSSKRIKKTGRGRSLKKESPEEFLEPAKLEETPVNQPKKKEFDEDIPDSPSVEEDTQEDDNELEFSDTPKSRGGRRSRPQSLETTVLSRARNRVGSQSPATGKESPISESSNDSVNSRSRGRLRQAIAEEISSLAESRLVTPLSGSKRGRGRGCWVKSELTSEIKKTAQCVELAQSLRNVPGRPKRPESEAGGSVPIALKTLKKKKKHFKGLRYSFGIKKKKPKPKLNQSLAMFDSSQDNDSLISEEVDADSFDSSSVETSSAPMSTGLDPYDPTEEFDDSQTEEKNELSYNQQRLQQKSLEERTPEEEHLEADEEESSNAEDDEEGTADGQEVAYIEQQYEDVAEGMTEDYQDALSNQDDEYMEDQEEPEEEDRPFEEEEQCEDDNPDYGELLHEEYEEEDVPVDYDFEANEEAIANGIEYVDDTGEGIEEAIAYESEQAERALQYERANGALEYNPTDYSNHLNEYSEENLEYEDVQLGYADEEQMEPADEDQIEHAEEDQMEPADEDQMEPADGEQIEPTDEEQMETSNEEQMEPAEEEQMEPAEEEQMETTEGEQIESEEDEMGQEQVELADDETEQEEPDVPSENEEVPSYQDDPAEDSCPETIEQQNDNAEQLEDMNEETDETGGVADGDYSQSEQTTDELQDPVSYQEKSEQLKEEQPSKQKKMVTKPKKPKKVKAKKYKKPIIHEKVDLSLTAGHKRKLTDDLKPYKKKRLLDDEIVSYVQDNDDTLATEETGDDTEELAQVAETPNCDSECGANTDLAEHFEDQISDLSQQDGEKLSPVEEPLLNMLAEEDSTDTSEASMNIKGEKPDGISRRVSKRRNGDPIPGMVDDKGDGRKSKRLNTMGSSRVLTIAARADGKSYPKLVEEIDQEVANSSLKTSLCKCRVNLNPKAVNVTGEIYCQGFDCFDGRMIGCCNIVANDTYLRVSPKIPFMLLCAIHRQRLRRHNCCPGCGLFCTQGLFYECRWDTDGIRHYYHKLCGLVVNGVTMCPHCGTSQTPVEVHLELKLSRKPVIYLKQHQEKKGLLSTARMTCPTLKTSTDAPASITGSTSDGPHLELANGTLITAARLPIGINKERLEDAIRSIKSGKIFNIKASPKAIYWACKYDDLEKLLWVLVSGLSPNAKVREYGNQTGLHTAAMYGSMASAHALVLAGACFDLTDTQLLTPLMVAISKGHNDLVNYIIQAGANLQARTDDGMTCLHLAAKAGNYEACKHILDSGRLSRHTINVQDEGGWTPLVWASENRCINVVKLLLDRGADPQICDVEQNTALHWAAFSGSTHICSMVLERGCSLKSMNGIGDTPLHIAARQNHVEVVVQLLARGAVLDVTNKRNQSPLECCLPDSQSFLHITLNKKLLDVMRDNGIRTERILTSDIACGKESVPITCVNGIDDEELPKNYVYISENCEALNVNIDRTISSLKWCECRDGCNTENCVCSQLNFQCWYDPEGKLLVDFNFADPPMIFECNRACGCNKLSCHNRVVQHGITAHMQLFKTSGKGWGVRALKDITKGSYVCEYVGEIITDLEADQREDDSYLFDLDNRDTETYCIDARQYANIARFINHLCEPNLTPVKVFIDHQDLVFPRIAFFANRDIEADEELGFDYGEKFWVIKYKQFTCTCGCQKCKYSSDNIEATLEAYNKKVLLHQQQETADTLSN